MSAYILKGSGNREHYDTHIGPAVYQTMGRRRSAIRVTHSKTEINPFHAGVQNLNLIQYTHTHLSYIAHTIDILNFLLDLNI
jgi:hypothetical protein